MHGRSEASISSLANGKAVRFLIETPLDNEVATFDLAQCTQPFTKRPLENLCRQHSDAPFPGCRLLRTRGKRPSSHATNSGDKVASPQRRVMYDACEALTAMMAKTHVLSPVDGVG